MAWEHFSVVKQGTCEIQSLLTMEITGVAYEMGTIETGKQHVFWGHQIVIHTPEVGIIGRAKGWNGSYLSALQDCNTQLMAAEWRLLVAGNVPTYRESAMSGDGGYGYIRGRRKALHLMSPLFAESEPETD